MPWTAGNMERFSPRRPRQCDENTNKLILSGVCYIHTRQNGPRAFGPRAVFGGREYSTLPSRVSLFPYSHLVFLVIFLNFQLLFWVFLE